MTQSVSSQQLQDLLKKGFEQLSRGNIDAAGSCCQQALAIKPDLVPAHFLVALVSLEAKDRKTAFSAFQSVVKLDKNHAAAWAHLAKLYLSEGQVNLADAALRETRRIKTDDPLVLDLIGTVLSLMGEHSVAQAFFAKTTTLRPNYPPFMLNLANNLIYHGETEQSQIILKDVIKIQPDSPQAHWALSSSQKAIDDHHIQQMQLLSKQQQNNPRALAFYQYAIGKEYEDQQQWQAAFKAFNQGAKARRATVEFDEQSEREMFESLKEKYTTQWLEDNQQGNDSCAPIFILGQPRTGTTLIERIITSHSQVHSAGELQQFSLALRRLTNYQNPKRFSKDLFEKALALEPRKIGGMYLQTSKRMQGDTPYFVDKLPQNYLMLPLILKALPNAKIIHLIRNPMDACFSSFKQLFADAYLHSYDLREMARHHARYLDLMKVWRERFSERFFEVSYENTTRELEPNARALINFLGLPWEGACLNFHQQDSAVTTASAVQVREPVHTRSIDRWRKYERQLLPMQEELNSCGVTIE
ncbi:MAG: sulfotransferase [Kangiellaceae bacterium]|nr:sulfotransferase [Kangiellaceae bacterium]